MKLSGNKQGLYMLIAVLAIVLLFIVKTYRSQKHAAREHYNKKYSGIISKIQHYDGDSGYPKILVNNEWIFLDVYDDWIAHYIKEGDSIVKDTGDIFLVYRLKNDGAWDYRKIRSPQ